MLWIFKRVKNAWSRKDFGGRSKSSAFSFSLSLLPIQQPLECHWKNHSKMGLVKSKTCQERNAQYFFHLSLEPVPCKPTILTEGCSSPRWFSTRIPLNLPVISYFWFKKTNFPIDGQMQHILQFLIYFQTSECLTSSGELNEIQEESCCPVLCFLWHIQIIVESPSSGWPLVREIFPHFLV